MHFTFPNHPPKTPNTQNKIIKLPDISPVLASNLTPERSDDKKSLKSPNKSQFLASILTPKKTVTKSIVNLAILPLDGRPAGSLQNFPVFESNTLRV